jgi:hypothetical protein
MTNSTHLIAPTEMQVKPPQLKKEEDDPAQEEMLLQNSTISQQQNQDSLAEENWPAISHDFKQENNLEKLIAEFEADDKAIVGKLETL